MVHLDVYPTVEADEAINRLYQRGLAAGIPQCTPDAQEGLLHPQNRAAQQPTSCDQLEDSYDVIVVGAGPAGLVLSLLLARHGLRKKGSMLCVEPREAPVPVGHADGLSSRSLEMFKELGLYEQVLKVGHQITEGVVWTLLPGSSKIQRVTKPQKYPTVPGARVPPMAACPQGQIERILEEELARYAPGTLERGSKVIDVHILDGEAGTGPVVVKVQDRSGRIRLARCKYLVGADGASSTVRASTGISMLGGPRDHTWGVIDFAADTDYPDIRRHGHVHSAKGRLMHLPREQNNEGEWLNRFYVDMNQFGEEKKYIARGKQAQQSRFGQADILQKIADVFHPYYMRPKSKTRIEWCSAYSVGRRIATEFTRRDHAGLPRVFLVGDACHLHSPKLGQGMNVSMADSYNLAWKLSHVLLGVTANPRALLSSYANERRAVAQQLLDIDERWYEFEWGPESSKYANNYLDRRAELLLSLSGFITGYGIRYQDGFLSVSSTKNKGEREAEQALFRSGYRVKPMPLQRFADGLSRDLHDELPLDGRWKVLLFTSSDLLDSAGCSAAAIRLLYQKFIPSFPTDIISASLIFPDCLDDPESKDKSIKVEECEWGQFPLCVKRQAEMKTFFTLPTSYNPSGLVVSEGKVVLVRPDGVISMVVPLDDLLGADSLLTFVERVVRVI
ncbi:FAD binding domain-containing protein [Aspergillus karnatakaensis]|uniref:FAD binding domain-containing protein n=1 Tax=Aspergillus karnatakaensis TaxID=1810916 RepID=UPI003CCDA13D